MVKENQIPIQKPVEEVYEIKVENEVKKSPLSPASRGKVVNKSGSNYISDNKEDYGPCQDTLCGCSCSSRTCICKNHLIVKAGEWGTGFSAYGRVQGEEENGLLKIMGQKDIKVGGQVSGQLFGYKGSNDEIKILSGAAGGKVGRHTLKGQLSADLYNVKANGIQGRIGASLDTGVSFEDGFEAKVAGFGAVCNDEQLGFSTPIGEIKVDKEKIKEKIEDNCSIQ